jgi:tetratricopeptide (TPR) repeat protein
LLLSAKLAVKAGQLDLAQQRSAQLLKLYPRHVPLYDWLANFALQSGHTDDALKWLRKGLELEPDNREMLWTLATLFLDRGMVHEALAPIRTLRALPGGDLKAKYLDARIELVEGHWAAARQAFDEVRPLLKGDPQMRSSLECFRALCYQQLGSAEQELDAYREAVKIAPQSLLAHQGVFVALQQMDRLDDAVAELAEIQKLPNAPSNAQLQLVRLLVKKNLQKPPAGRNWREVETALQQAARALPHAVETPIVRAEVLAARNRLADAEKVLLEARKEHPKAMALWTTLAFVAGRQYHWKQAARWLDDAQRQLGDSGALRQARALLAFAELGPQSAAQLRKLAEHTDRLQPQESVALCSGLALLAYRAEDYLLARTLCRQVWKLQPANAECRTLLLEIALRSRDVTDLEDTLRQIEANEGKTARWQFGTAVELFAQVKANDPLLVEQALQHLIAARELSPQWSIVPLLGGELQILLGRESDAVGNLLLAIHLGERNPNTLRQVIRLLQGNQRFLEVDWVLRQLARQRPRYGLTQDYDDLLYVKQIAEQVAAKSKDPSDQLWLAQILEVLGLRARHEERVVESQSLLHQAEKVLLRATETGDDAPAAWAALIGFYIRTDQVPAATNAMVRVQENGALVKAPLAMPQLCMMLGQRTQAVQRSEQAILNAANDYILDRSAEMFSRLGQEEQFRILLQKIISGKSPASGKVIAWARRKEAWTLATRGERRDREIALRLLEQNLASAQASPQDRRMRTLLLATDFRRAGRREAIRLLVAQPARLPDEQYLLVQLYMAEGEWVKAREQFRTLMTVQADRPEYVNAFVTALLARNELDEAEGWLSWLEKLTPDQFATIHLRATLLVHRLRFEEARSLLHKYLSQPGIDARDKAVQQDQVAAVFEEFARTIRNSDHADEASRFSREAEQIRRELVKQYPQQRLVLAVLLVEEQRLDEAIQLFQQGWPIASPAVIGEASQVLLAAALTPPQVEEVDKVLRAALERFDRPLPLLLTMARLRLKQGRYQEAESIFRECVGKDGSNITGLASLAVLLAEQRTYSDEAMQLVEKAISIAGPAPELLDARAVVNMALSQPAKARADLDAAIAQRPNPVWYYHRAQALKALGDRKAADQSLARAMQMGFKPEMLHPLEQAAANQGKKKT